MISFDCKKDMKLSDFCMKNAGMTYGKFCGLLKKKDIKVNGKRTNKDTDIYTGDKIEIYGFDPISVNPVKVVYNDDNITIVNKPSGIQVKKDDVIDNKLCVEDYFPGKIAIHRLDRNTSGLLILTNNETIYNEFVKAFSEHRIEKYYMTLCYGNFQTEKGILKGYLEKDSLTGTSRVLNKKTSKSEEIITEYLVKKQYNNFAQSEIKLVTGKTHQIRAHLTSINHSIVGDSKYQNKEFSEFNKLIRHKIKSQCLVAYKLRFNFPQNSVLNYLDKKEIIIDYDFDLIIDYLINTIEQIKK